MLYKFYFYLYFGRNLPTLLAINEMYSSAASVSSTIYIISFKEGTNCMIVTYDIVVLRHRDSETEVLKY